MKSFLHDNFLLHNTVARTLYHEVAKHQPIYDYHCHLSPSQIADDHQFADLADIWLAGDHYKWRALRTLGVDERLITGDASPREKFQAYAEAVPKFIGNPLYHWTHLELKRPFGIDDVLLNGHTAEAVWQRCNELLSQPEFSARGILRQMNVKMVGTTDDPVDDLLAHARIAEDSQFDIEVCPSFRPDKALNIDREDFNQYMHKLGECSDVAIEKFSDLTDAMSKRLAYFAQHGCVASDHGLEILRYASIPNEQTLNVIMRKGLKNQALTEEEIAQYQTALLVFLGHEYHRRSIVMQMHIGPIRNNNRRMFEQLGADSGYDSIGDRLIAEPLAKLLNEMEQTSQLPKTILYTINPRDNEVLATMVGNFQGEGIRGKVQFGSGWWFNDQKDGMLRQLQTHAQMGLLSVFVGMLTDSRSFLSFTRHEYFRRLLCQMIGQWVVDGEAPHDMTLLGDMVADICYGNAKEFFAQKVEG